MTFKCTWKLHLVMFISSFHNRQKTFADLLLW